MDMNPNSPTPACAPMQPLWGSPCRPLPLVPAPQWGVRLHPALPTAALHCGVSMGLMPTWVPPPPHSPVFRVVSVYLFVCFWTLFPSFGTVKRFPPSHNNVCGRFVHPSPPPQTIRPHSSSGMGVRAAPNPFLVKEMGIPVWGSTVTLQLLPYSLTALGAPIPPNPPMTAGLSPFPQPPPPAIPLCSFSTNYLSQ